ncbi:hypothetical protein NX801_04980 [Streptomyces sp. LP05-1]|uniref:TrbL/VirB6 plasmid conjugal transfer protein n=1 Tax=Streptomyces pyxinae TaxID=2970734 RepID=A0ABT2CC74_9ACTN|nr:hypothetical protein [Streptomyces sp. LP05-1]MCS0635021.1 hypothetical protein [Streptomyces sp. LP05-1]
MSVRHSARPPGAPAAARSLSDRVRGAGRAVRAGLFLVFALLALTLAVPGTAHADFACQFTGDDRYVLDRPGANGEGLIPAVTQWEEGAAQGPQNLSDSRGTASGAVEMGKEASHYTLYELNGTRGLNWSMTFKDESDGKKDNGDWFSGADDCAVMDYVNNGVADSVFWGTKFLSRGAISIKELASNPRPLSGLYQGRDNVVGTLKNHVFIPMVYVMVLLLGLWVFGKWRREQMREIWAGVGWATLSTIAVVALLTGGNYDKLIDRADAGIGQANSKLSELMLSGASGTAQPPCDLPPDEKPNRGLRMSSCAMYDTLAFRPWALGQFGQVGNDCVFHQGGGRVENGVCVPKSGSTKCSWGEGARCEDLRARQVVAQSVTNKDAFSKEKSDKFNGQWTPIRQELASGGNYPVGYDEWAGGNSGNRVGLAFYSLIAALIVGLMVIVLSGLTLLWHAVTLILVVLLPLVAALGIHPSQQKLLKGWLETFIHSFVLRAGFGVILSVLLVLYQMILPARIALGMQLLLLLLVTIAVVMMLKKLLAGNFSPRIAGAEDALGVRDMAGAVAGKVGLAAPGAALSAGRLAGRVSASSASLAGRTAAGGAVRTARGLDTALLGRRLQKGGWVAANNSKRQQRKDAYRAREIQKRQYDAAAGGPADTGTPIPAVPPATPPAARPAGPAAPAPGAPPAGTAGGRPRTPDAPVAGATPPVGEAAAPRPARGGRVSLQPPAPAPSSPAPAPAPAPGPAAAPRPSVPAPRTGPPAARPAAQPGPVEPPQPRDDHRMPR